MNYKDLEDLGLSEKESKVYLALLQLGNTTVQEAAKKSKVNRATTYVVIDSLAEKGLVSSFTEGKKQYFCAESPEKLTMLFREQALEIKRKQEQLDGILPELKAFKKDKTEGPVVRYFEGKEGMRAIAEEIFLDKSSDKLRMIYSYDLLLEMFGEKEINEMRKRRQKRNVKVQAITNDKHNRLVTDTETYRVSPGISSITSDIAVFGNRIRIISQKGKSTGLIIENKEIADTLKILFDMAINSLKKKKG